MSISLDDLRRDAAKLKKAHAAGDQVAQQRIAAIAPRTGGTPLKHADFLHVIARENGFASWPAMKLSVELLGMDKAARRQRLKAAIHHGQHKTVLRLLEDTPDLSDGDLGLEIALYRREAVETALADDPGLATRPLGLAPAFVHLAQSRMFRVWPDKKGDMIAIAELLLSHGADTNAGAPAAQGSDHMLSPLYFALGHADNIVLGEWLLGHGADPNDGESLYHSTELGHHDALRLLLKHGADPRGTNALLRAMDFHDLAAMRLLMDAGATPEEFNGEVVGGEEPYVIPALHQAARRHCAAEIVRCLIDAGADVNLRYKGATPYAFARAFGNREMVKELLRHGADQKLSTAESLLADAADGRDVPAKRIDQNDLPSAYDDFLRVLIGLPNRLEHVRRLVTLGLLFDDPDRHEGLTPVQIAGWEGMADIMAYLLDQGPDLSHVNAYGGTLLSTIIHGSENCPPRADRDHVACLELALAAGVTIPRRAPDLAGDEAISAALSARIESHPEQVAEGGVV